MWHKIEFPDEECLAHGPKYLCQIDRGADGHKGVVWGEAGTVRWHYGTRRNPIGFRLRNPFNKPDFIVADPETKGELIIRRASFVPPVFHIMEAGNVIGQIRLRSILRNKYTINLGDTGVWTFRMPLFTIRFWGASAVGAGVWVAVGPSKMEWKILIKPGLNDRLLVAALAFIHNEWWNYS